LLLTGTLCGEWARVDLSAVDARSLLAMAYLIIFGSIIAFTAYMWLLRVRSASAVSTYAFVNPVVAVVVGVFVGGEHLSQRALFAAGLIILAVMLILIRRPTLSPARKKI
jgi:drug/metabolite transporter (DMT)-like permease